MINLICRIFGHKNEVWEELEHSTLWRCERCGHDTQTSTIELPTFITMTNYKCDKCGASSINHLCPGKATRGQNNE